VQPTTPAQVRDGALDRIVKAPFAWPPTEDEIAALKLSRSRPTAADGQRWLASLNSGYSQQPAAPVATPSMGERQSANHLRTVRCEGVSLACAFTGDETREFERNVKTMEETLKQLRTAYHGPVTTSAGTIIGVSLASKWKCVVAHQLCCLCTLKLPRIVSRHVSVIVNLNCSV
jgi:hypothetical protein